MFSSTAVAAVHCYTAALLACCRFCTAGASPAQPVGDLIDRPKPSRRCLLMLRGLGPVRLGRPCFTFPPSGLTPPTRLVLPSCCRVVTLLSTQPTQQLLPFAANEALLTVTVDSKADYSQPLTVLLDDQPCQIVLTDPTSPAPSEVSTVKYVKYV